LVGLLQMASEAQGDGECATHTRPTSGALGEPVSHPLLPLDVQWQQDLAEIHWPTKNPPKLFGPDETTLRAFIREYLFISLFKACAEFLASENASRLAAMHRAEKNVGALFTNLNRTCYRLRQSSIDEEFFDVIAGFNAISRKASGSDR
jgi:F-type H+-transporting ATPase subunit gamma